VAKRDKRVDKEDCFPTNVPSSRYQRFKSTESQRFTASMNCKITSEKSKGTKGSPCFTQENFSIVKAKQNWLGITPLNPGRNFIQTHQ